MAKFNIKNLKQFQKRLNKRVIEGSERELGHLIQRSADLVKRTAVESIASGNKTGRAYSRGGKIHIASAAGEPPATDTGVLASSISTRVKEERKEIIGQVIASAPYAYWLEHGTRRMLEAGGARPFMQPALEKNRSRIKRMFKDGGYIK